MSSIAGIVGLKQDAAVSEQELLAMLRSMAIPGECQTRTLLDFEKRMAVGKNSYSPDDEPAPSSDRPDGPRLFMVGEVLNDDVNRSPSQAAYLLDRYRRRGGADFAAGLNGSFAAAIVDRADGAVMLVTDHMNSRPIFVAVHQNKLYFATEVKGLMAVKHLPCEPNPAAVLSMLTCNQLLGLETFIAGVEQLDYATVCRVKNGRVSSEQVWRYSIDDDARDEGAEVYLDRARSALRRAAARCVGPGKTAILLSGGEDSRLIVSFLNDASQVTAITYTGQGENERNAFGDAVLAARLAELVGMEHHVVRYDPREVLSAIRQSVYDSDGAAGFIHQNIWDRIRERFGLDYVILGDECFGLTAGKVHESQVLDCLMIRSLKSLPRLWPFLNRGRIEEFLEFSEESCRHVQADRLGRPPHNQVDELWHCQGLARWANPKRRSLARHGLLVRRPLLDRELLDLIATAPYWCRRSKRLAREALRRERPDLAKLSRARRNETANYRASIAALEADGELSAFILDKNPLLERFFDAEAVRELIARVARATPRQRPRRPRWRSWIPPRWRAWLVGKARRYLGARAGVLGDPADLLIRVATVACTLRHVWRRCPGGD